MVRDRTSDKYSGTKSLPRVMAPKTCSGSARGNRGSGIGPGANPGIIISGGAALGAASTAGA